MYIVYGIPNCDTVKKATTWLQKHKIPFRFHDYKKLGITKDKVKSWCKQSEWETILNKKGTTWRQMDPAIQAKVMNIDSAAKILIENTSAIKRPLIELDEKVIVVGFDEATYQTLFKK
jgi:Spx/MgsR family transcriptional regulator